MSPSPRACHLLSPNRQQFCHRSGTALQPLATSVSTRTAVSAPVALIPRSTVRALRVQERGCASAEAVPSPDLASRPTTTVWYLQLTVPYLELDSQPGAGREPRKVGLQRITAGRLLLHAMRQVSGQNTLSLNLEPKWLRTCAQFPNLKNTLANTLRFKNGSWIVLRFLK